MPHSNGPMVGCGVIVALVAACIGWLMLFLAREAGNGLLVKGLGLNPREEAMQTIAVYTALWLAVGFGAGCVIYLFVAK